MTEPSIKYGVDTAPEPAAKYGVDTEPAVVKSGARCPKCRAGLIRVGPPTCPRCGTEPFELAKDASDVKPLAEPEP